MNKEDQHAYQSRSGSTFFGLPQYQQLFGRKVATASPFTSSSFPLSAMNASRIPLFLLLFVVATSLTGCAAIAGIFKAGAYTGIIAVFVVVALLFFIVNKLRGPRS